MIAPFYLVVVERGAAAPEALVLREDVHATAVAQDAGEDERALRRRLQIHVEALIEARSRVDGAVFVLAGCDDEALFEHRVAIARQLVLALRESPGARLLLTASQRRQQHELMALAGALVEGEAPGGLEVVVHPEVQWHSPHAS